MPTKNVPAPHSEQEVLPFGLDLPAPQEIQAMLPSPACIYPLGQAVHFCVPVVLEYCPVEHSEHMSDSAPLY